MLYSTSVCLVLVWKKERGDTRKSSPHRVSRRKCGPLMGNVFTFLDLGLAATVWTSALTVETCSWRAATMGWSLSGA